MQLQWGYNIFWRRATSVILLLQTPEIFARFFYLFHRCWLVQSVHGISIFYGRLLLKYCISRDAIEWTNKLLPLTTQWNMNARQCLLQTKKQKHWFKREAVTVRLRAIVKWTPLAVMTPLRNRSLPRLNKRRNLCPEGAFTRHSPTFRHHNLPPLSISFLHISSRLFISHALSVALTTREHADWWESSLSQSISRLQLPQFGYIAARVSLWQKVAAITAL